MKRIATVLVVAATLVMVGILAGEAISPEREADELRPPESVRRVAPGPTRLLPPPASARAEARARPSLPASGGPGPEIQPAGAPWDLVEELERLAARGDGFHANALEIVFELRQRSREGAPAWVHELEAGVVRNEARGDRVRGAVFLALAPLLEEREFLDVFASWLSSSPPELVRASALAAEQRGPVSSCEALVDLDRFAALPLAGGVRPPSLYPMDLRRVVEDEPTRLLLQVLTNRDPRLDEIDQTAAVDADAEVVVTRELVLLVLGPRALQDAAVEGVLWASASASGSLEDGHSVATIRAAHFVFHSLAACRATWKQSVEEWSSASSLSGELSRLMSDHFVGRSFEEVLAIARRARRAPDLDGQLHLVDALAELSSAIADGRADPDGADTAALFLLEVVLDDVEPELVRQAALFRLAECGAWEPLCDGAESVLAFAESADLRAQAVRTLGLALESPSAARARALLDQALRTEPAPRVRALLERALRSD